MKETRERHPSPKKNLRRINRTADHYTKMKDYKYTPTEEDISYLLKDFILDFLLDGKNTNYISKSHLTFEVSIKATTHWWANCIKKYCKTITYG